MKTGHLQILPLNQSDAIALDRLLARYADQGFSLADASLMHLAEREAIRRVFMIDAKDFSVFRTTVGESLEIIA